MQTTRSVSPLPFDLVCNTGPILALGKMGVLEALPSLRLEIVFPSAVAEELDAGVRQGFSISRPDWIPVVDHPASPAFEASLDRGEAAVLQLALALDVKMVCIDEWRGRRAAHATGLGVVGSLGILGRLVRNGTVNDPRSILHKAVLAGVRYDPELLERFLVSLSID
jgi:predicted nucleic acid-binding protein